MTANSLHYRTCNLCEAMCGLEIEHAGEKIVAIRGDQQDPLSQGYLCPKAVALQDLHNDPDRLRYPMKKTKAGWQQISWDEALAETAQKLAEVQRRHGRNAAAVYAGNPTVHNHGAMLTLLPFLQALGTRNRYSATSVDQLPHMLASLKLFGHQLLLPVPDIDRTEHFLVIGANPIASNGSLMTAPDMRGRLKALRARGGRLVVVDPRKTETAQLADEHHFIRPGNDVVLLLAMLNVLFTQDRIAAGKLAPLLDNLDQLKQMVLPWTPDKAASYCAIDASTIERLSLDFSAAGSASAYCRVGTCTSQHSSLAAWLVYVLNIVTGNLDKAGGLMFPTSAADMITLAANAGHLGGFDRYRSRVRNLPEFGGEFPVTTLADEMLTPGEGQVRALVTHAGNPVLSSPNGSRLDSALEQLEFMVSIDLYINETTRHADIILPPTGHLEHGQFDPVFHGLAVRNTIKYSPSLFKPAAGARHDWEILLELIRRLQIAKGTAAWQAKLTETVMRRVGDTGMIDLLLRLGPYGQGRWAQRKIDTLLSGVPFLGALFQRSRFKVSSQKTNSSEVTDEKKLTLRKVRDQVHGIDLGPLKPVLPERLFTPQKRINLVPSIYPEALNALQALLIPKQNDELLLIGRRHVRSNNSWMHNSYRLVKGKPRCDLMINTQDAMRLGIDQGDSVQVTGAAGAVTLPAMISEEIMPGVVSMPHGWGHGRKGVRLSVAGKHAGVSINDVIGAEDVEHVSGMAVLNGVPVQVEKV